MLRRLPISLRFDDEESDFYYGFIEQKKNDRELSTLILDLLHCYYENDIVRNNVDKYIMDKSPYKFIHEEIQRIALEHNRQSVSTSMLGDYTENEKKKVSETPEPSNENEQDSDVKEETPLMLPKETVKEIEDLRNEVAQMGELRNEIAQMKDLIKQVVSNGNLNIAGLKEKDVGVSEKIVDDSFKMEEEKKPPVLQSSKKVEEKSEVETLIPDATPLMQEEPKVKKPASFGKLLNSMK